MYKTSKPVFCIVSILDLMIGLWLGQIESLVSKHLFFSLPASCSGIAADMAIYCFNPSTHEMYLNTFNGLVRTSQGTLHLH
jgi:hypothetical protein